MLIKWRDIVSNLCFLPQRYILCILGFFAILNAYTMRISLSLAITEMVIPLNKTETNFTEACPVSEESSRAISAVKDLNILYPWTESIQGLILSGFFWGYIATHIPGGILAEKFGGKHTLGLGILVAGIFTFVTPWVCYSTMGSWLAVVLLRVFVGFGEGTTFPALTVLLAKWAPTHERATMTALMYAGSNVGSILSNLLGGKLISSTESWASVFFVFGGASIIWYVLFTLMCYSEPETHPFITEKEKSFLKKEMSGVSRKNLPTPWRSILTSVPVWALILVQIGHTWGLFTIGTNLPKYMKYVLRFNVKQNGLWSSMPYVFMLVVTLVAGRICDWLIKSGCISTTFARKMFTTLGQTGPAIFILAASYSGCDRMLAVWMFTIGMGCMGFYTCGMRTNVLDVAPNFAGSVMAVINGIGALSGVVAPYLAGALTPDNTLVQWGRVFWLTFLFLAVTNVVYVIFGTGEEQPWNDPNFGKVQAELGGNEKNLNVEEIGYQNMAYSQDEEKRRKLESTRI